jgi:hypothetical protein
MEFIMRIALQKQCAGAGGPHQVRADMMPKVRQPAVA